MKMKLLSVLILSVFVSTSAGAKCVGVIPAGSDHVFWKEIIRGASAAASELGLEDYSRGPSDESNASGQLAIMDRAMGQGCGGLVLAPNSPEVVAKVGELSAAGTPTVYIDRDMGGDRLSVVMTDNYAAGEEAGRMMAEMLGGSGTVGVLRMDSSVSSTTERENGFLEAAKEAGLEVAFEEQIGTQVGDARGNAERLLASADVDGIFTPNESTTVGSLLALKKLQKAGAIAHIGFDFAPVLQEAIEAGELTGVMVQQPYMMGYTGVMTLSAAMNGESVQEMSFVEPFYVDKANMSSPEIQEKLGAGAGGS